MAPEQDYLDYNATAPLRPEARDAMMAVMGPPLNASSIHNMGRKARMMVDEARVQIAQSLGARHADIIFTSGATESNNMILAAYRHIITSSVEHSAILAPRPDAVRVPVDGNGIIDLAMLERALSALSDDERPHTLVSVIAANNETGTIQPLADIGRLCQAHKVAFHSDMVQMAGKQMVDLSTEGLSFASFSAHKIGGPSGIGALWIKPGHIVPPFLHGGGQEQGRRPGTENVLGIVGFGAAMQAATHSLSSFSEIAKWRDAFEQDISTQRNDVTILGKDAPRLANTSLIALSSVSSQTALMSLDLQGFCLSSGSACSSGKVAASHVVEAMGRDDLAGHVLRISGGWDTSKDTYQRLAKALVTL